MTAKPLTEKLIEHYGFFSMPRFIVKYGDWYFFFNTDGNCVDSPAFIRDEIRAVYYYAYGYEKFLTLEEQLLQAEKHGTSVPWPTTAEELLATNEMVHTIVSNAGSDDIDDVWSEMSFESVIAYAIDLRSKMTDYDKERMAEKLAQLETIVIPYQVELLYEKVKYYDNLCETEKKLLKNVKAPDYEKMSAAHMQANVWRAALVLVIESFGLEPGKIITRLNT